MHIITILRTYLILLSLAWLLASCKGDPGAQGPQGPQGPPGTGGGSSGKVYEVNIPFSTFTGPTSTGYYFREFSVTNLTINPTDIVMVYRLTANGGVINYSALPYDDQYSTTLSNNYSFDYTNNNKVIVYVRRSDGGVPANTDVNYQFRIAVITATQGKRLPEKARKDYLVLKEFLKAEANAQSN